MKIQFVSDIHLEFDQRLLRRNHVQNSDVLVLAGDIAGTPRELLSFVEKLNYPGPILYVLGNHEFYHTPWDLGTALYQNTLEKLSNAHLLEGDFIEISGVRFLGCSLWTDFFNGEHGPASESTSLSDPGLADFKYIFWSKSGTPRPPQTSLKWEDVRDRYEASLKWLKEELAKPFNGKTVVVTHHAPSVLSNDPTFLDSPVTGAFCNRLDDWISGLGEKGPELWIHGHCHNSSDYNVGKTRVLCNPGGYPFQPNLDYNPELIVEL